MSHAIRENGFCCRSSLVFNICQFCGGFGGGIFKDLIDGWLLTRFLDYLGVLNLSRISSSTQEDSGGNVHSGAPPPWLSPTERILLDNKLDRGQGDLLSSLGEPVKSSKLNPKRVGAAWAERRKIELELEKRGELVRHNFDADWLPNFGRVWQSGSRKESRKEFLGDNKTCGKVNSQIENPSQLQPYISKRMVSLTCILEFHWHPRSLIFLCVIGFKLYLWNFIVLSSLRLSLKYLFHEWIVVPSQRTKLSFSLRLLNIQWEQFWMCCLFFSDCCYSL